MGRKKGDLALTGIQNIADVPKHRSAAEEKLVPQIIKNIDANF